MAALKCVKDFAQLDVFRGMMATESNPAPSPAPRSLPRAVGMLGSTAIVVGTIIGSGIFLVPHDVAQQVSSVRALMLVWIIGGILSFGGALSLAELGAATPEAGGVYVYLRQAYGKLFAFLYGWAALLVIESGSIATLAVAFSIYAAAFLPFSPLQQKMISAGVIAVLSIVNIAGVRKGAAVQTVFMVAKLAGLAIIMGFAFFRTVTPLAATSPLPTPQTTFSSFGVALIGVLWAYQGWHMLSYAAGEVRDPSRVLPRSYFVGTTVIVAVYLLANAAYLRVLPLSALAQHQRVAAEVMTLLVGPRGSAFVSALILCSIFGSLNGNVLGGARVYFAMARDGVFFKAVGRIHPRFETPAVAIVVQGVWAAILAASGSYKQLYTYVIFTGWIFYGAAVLAVIAVRRKQPGLARPYRVWGYPFLPIAFALASLVIVVSTLVGSPKESGIGLALVFAGVPIYFVWNRLKSARGKPA
jgi:basic amino acid/polyamine antiporter, APA family